MTERKVKVPKGVGEVAVDANGGFTVCEFGLAIRMGIANTPPEAARDLYPSFELLPGEIRAAGEDVIAGVPVFCWVVGRYMQTVTGSSERSVRSWVQKGMPHRPAKGGREYPIPHAVIWHHEYQAECAAQGACAYLPLKLALARHRLREVERELSHEH